MNICIYNGVKVLNRQLISVYNGSFLYGINCFEGLRGYWDAKTNQLYLLDLDHHLDRLFDSAMRLRLNQKITKDEVKSQLMQLRLTQKIKENIYVRITLFIDGETSWVEQENISYLISIRSMASSLHENFLRQKYSLNVSSFLRNSEFSTPPSIKAGGNYLNSRYAKLEAIERGFDDALIVNHKGFISESTGSCIFFIKQNTLMTPSLDCDILPSITRRRVISLCKKNDIEVMESHITTEDINSFDGAFLCGSMIEIMPISLIDKKQMNTYDLPLYHSIVELFKQSIFVENI